jgi:hypothetical protein
MSTIEPDSLDYELLPPDPGLINPDLALDAALAPVEDIENDAPAPFGRSWRFDFQAGQFIRDGTVPLVVYEMDTLIMWIEKTLRTARLAHPIYADEYGVEDPDELIGQVLVGEEDLSSYEESINAALTYHDRIISVEDFSFTQDPFEETLYASFTVMVDAAPPLEPQPLEFSDVPVGTS